MTMQQRPVANLEEYLASLDAEQVDRLAVAEFIMDVTLLAIELRQRRGVSQAELAERLGKSQQAVSAFERPHADLNLMSLCKHLHALDYGLELTVTDQATGQRVGCVSLSQSGGEHAELDERVAAAR
jgi:ribosome-binding protein aMBF1 (putative translation factor)